MKISEIRALINRVLGNSLRLLLPSYWWKKVFHHIVDKVEEVDTLKANRSELVVVRDAVPKNLPLYVTTEEGEQTLLSDFRTANMESVASLSNTIKFPDKRNVQLYVYDKDNGTYIQQAILYIGKTFSNIRIYTLASGTGNTTLSFAKYYLYEFGYGGTVRRTTVDADALPPSYQLFIPYYPDGSTVVTLTSVTLEKNKEFYQACSTIAQRVENPALLVEVIGTGYAAFGAIVAIDSAPMNQRKNPIFVTIRYGKVDYHILTHDKSLIYEQTFSINSEGEVSIVTSAIAPAMSDIYIDGNGIYGYNGKLNDTEKRLNASAFAVLDKLASEKGDFRKYNFMVYLKKATLHYFRITEHSPIGMVTGEDATGKYIEFEFQANTMGSVYTCKLREDGTSETTASANILNTPV